MTLAETLTAILERSREPAALNGKGERTLAGSDAEARLKAICGEIGETILPRKLTFRIGGNGLLTAAVGARKLTRILAVSPDNLVQPGQEVFVARDDKKAAEQNKAIAHLLADFSAISGDLMIVSELPEGSDAGSTVGFPPGKLLELALKHAKTKPAEKPVTKVKPEEPKPEPVPEPAPVQKPVKLDPTAAMKALIREKAKAAADAPPKVAPAPADKKKANVGDDAVRAFFEEVSSYVDFCAVLNAHGNVEAVNGKLETEGLLNVAADIVTDLSRWRKMTVEVLSPAQIIVLRAGGIENQSVAYFADDYGVAIAIFGNTDLSRIFISANKVLVPKGAK